MIASSDINRLASLGLDCWGAGRLEEARSHYLAALALIDPGHSAEPGLKGQLAGVLAALGDVEGATAQYTQAVDGELALGEADGGIALLIARYFLANHLVIAGAPEQALAAIAPSLAAKPDHWLTRVVQAEALYALGRFADSRDAAEAAVARAPSAAKAQELTLHLKAMLEGPGGSGEAG
ncbi:hypothetical protein CDN99_00660 [Roseateles aquatilis]|uniref:Tetratrico peptide repeat group 5 domain-containing protein n=1 Tax=Roseateles aquatilis TaxID=431061 RepID=A0A246JKB5_9BURK|nr:hypothetical protein [Roseateles aquatilis]OWQ93051.1 hypothetical protein CDN99_00660 [Roseateles aquatilis]